MKSTKTYIIAEAGVNHNGCRDLAFSLIDVAADAGVDAIKFQTFDAVKLAKKSLAQAAYQARNTGVVETQQEMLKKLELPLEWHDELKIYANSKGIHFLSTAFDSGSLQFLNELGMPLFKVPSGELTNGPLLWMFARTGKPLIVSTGMATISEVEQGLAIISHALSAEGIPASIDAVWEAWSRGDWRSKLNGHVTLLHCTSQYPTPHHEVNLRAMDTLKAAFGLDVGYSDHTAGTLIPIAAVARGARIIEKHFTLDHNLPGPDHKASLMPSDLKQMVNDIRALEVAIGDGIKAPQLSEFDTRLAARQQVVAATAIEQGDLFNLANLTTARCGVGMAPSELWGLIGKSSNRSYSDGESIDK